MALTCTFCSWSRMAASPANKCTVILIYAYTGRSALADQGAAGRPDEAPGDSRWLASTADALAAIARLSLYAALGGFEGAASRTMTVSTTGPSSASNTMPAEFKDDTQWTFDAPSRRSSTEVQVCEAL